MSFKYLCKAILITLLLMLALVLMSSCKNSNECTHGSLSQKSVVPPTCQNEGYTIYSCNNCTFEYKGSFVAPLAHTLTSVVTEPTCNTEGYTTHSCECGYTYKSDYRTPINHAFEKTVVSATCTSQGYTVSLCSECSASFVSDLTPQLPHDMTATVVAPDCDDEGFTKKECKNCEYEFISDKVAPLGHSLTSVVTYPGCETEGFTTNSCKNCEYEFVSDKVAPLGHTLTSVVTPPTCEDEGFTTYSCSADGCDFGYVADFIPPTGHAITLTQKHASAREAGYIKHTCPCGYEYIDHIMPTDVFTGAYADSDVPLAKGIDVSKWNETLDFEAIKAAGFDFVIIKAGSIVGKDPYFEENYAAAKAAGLDVGAYFYTYAKNLDEIDEEAELFLSWLEGKQFEYPVYFDIEDPSMETLGRSLLTDMSVRFIERLQSEGYFCGIYVNNNWLMNLLDTERITTYFDVWYARYKVEDIENWGESWGDLYGMWQYTASGEIGEHECLFDMNFVYRDYPTLIKEWGYNGFVV